MPPKVNLKLLKLLSSWQPKCDVKNTKISSEDTMSVLREIHSGGFSVQRISQKQQILLQYWVKLLMNFLLTNNEWKDLRSSN